MRQAVARALRAHSRNALESKEARGQLQRAALSASASSSRRRLHTLRAFAVGRLCLKQDAASWGKYSAIKGKRRFIVALLRRMKARCAPPTIHYSLSTARFGRYVIRPPAACYFVSLSPFSLTCASCVSCSPVPYYLPSLPYRLLRSPLHARVSAHRLSIWAFRRFSAGLLAWQCQHHRSVASAYDTPLLASAY
jgi:hypothetical protein